MNRHFIPGLAYMIALSTIISELAVLVMEEYEFSLFPHMLIIYGPLLFIVSFIFLQKERSYATLIILCAVFAVACTGIAIYCYPFERAAGYIAAALIILFLTYSAANLGIKPAEVGALLIILDVSFVCLVIMGFMSSIRGVPVFNCVLLAIAAIVSLFGLILARLERTPDAKDLLSFGILFAIIGAIVSFLIAFAAEPAGTGMVKIVTAIWRGFLFVIYKIGAFVLYLFSLITAPEAAPAVLEQGGPSFSADDIIIEETTLPGWIWVIPVIIGIILFVIIILLVRKMRVSGIGGNKISAVTSKVSFWEGLKLSIRKFRASIKRRSYLRKNKNTAIGLYYNLEELCRRTKAEKQISETPSEFITRLSLSAADETDTDFLNDLSSKVTYALYSDRKPTDSEADRFDLSYCEGLLSRIKSAL